MEKIRDWLKQNRIVVFLFFLALIPRLVFMLVAYFKLGDYRFVEGRDGYLMAGLNLLIHGIFTAESVPPLTPHSFPPPGYSILLAISWLIIPKYLFIVFWQNIIYSVFIVFVYKFARLFFNNFVSIGTALLMALEPFSFFWSNVVMSEASFLVFFMLTIYFLALFWQGQKWKFIIYSAILLGIAALIRPIATYFYPVVVVSAVIMLWRQITWPKLAKFLIVYLIVFLAVTAPWAIRNKIQFGDYTISNQTHLLYFLDAARDFLVLTADLSTDQAEEYLKNLAVAKAGVKDFNEIFLNDKYIQVLKEITFSIIKTHPLVYLKLHLIKALPVFTDSGWTNILTFWQVDLGGAQSVNISNLFVQRNFQALFSSWKNIPAFWIRILGIAFWLLIDVIALAGIILMLRNEKLFRIALVMLVIIGYFFITSSWAAMARLRLPFQPFLFIFFSYAIYNFYLKYIFILEIEQSENKRQLDNSLY